MAYTVPAKVVDFGRWVPKGSIKIADKKSDAVAYLYDGGSQAAVGGKPVPCARVFYGKQRKPVAAYQFPTEAARATKVGELFAGRQAWGVRKADRKTAQIAAAKAGNVEVGTYFYTSWGYDQTNIDWYRVEQLIGQTMALVVKVAAMDASNGNEVSMTGKSVPSDQPCGQPFKVRLNGDGFKVNGRYYANLWDGKPKNWTAYA